MTKHWPALDAFEADREDKGYRNRTASARDLDDMIGVILDGIDALGPATAANTWVVFTSDNGFHLGEHRMLFGKEHPYDTDVRLPFYVRGPGVPANVTRLHPTTHVDLTATLVELGGATPVGPPLDGMSFAAALTATPVAPAAWRNHSFSEHFGKGNTWVSLRSPLAGAAGTAARTTFTWWCQDTAEVFDHDADPWQMVNEAYATPRGQRVANDSLPAAYAFSTCAGAACNALVVPGKVPKKPLPCYTPTLLATGEFEYDVA